MQLTRLNTPGRNKRRLAVSSTSAYLSYFSTRNGSDLCAIPIRPTLERTRCHQWRGHATRSESLFHAAPRCCRANSANLSTLCFFIRTSNFGAEAERSYLFLRFEAENVLKMFSILHSIRYMYFSKSMWTWPGNLSKCIACWVMVSRNADYDKPRCVSPLLMLYKTCP